MQAKTIIERFGGIYKRETLTSLQDEMFDSLVYEASRPFPGYYEEYSTVKKPLYFYLVLKEPIGMEEVIRANQNVRKRCKVAFEATKSKISLLHEQLPVVRIRNIEKEENLVELINLYKENGFEFQKKISKESKAEVLIKIYKFFKLEDLGDDIFMDHSEKEFLYFNLPRAINWELFEKATINVKYNWNKSAFDAAFGYFFQDEKVTDMVRIYHEKVDKAYIEELKGLYFKEIERWE